MELDKIKEDGMKDELWIYTKSMIIASFVLFIIFTTVVLLASILNIEPSTRPKQEINHNNYAERK
jgi:CHASE3 domain sensor protein